MITPEKKAHYFMALLVLAFSIIYYLSYAAFGYSESDWGMILSGAERFLNGQVFYRDFGIVYTPGIYIYTAVAFKMFGISQLAGSIAWSILRSVSCVLIYLIVARIVSGRIALFSPLFLWIAPGPLHKSFFITFSLLNIYMITKLLLSNSWKLYLVAGLIAGLTLIFRIDLFGFYGITILVVEVIKVFEQKQRDIRIMQLKKSIANYLLIGAGAVVGVMPLIIYFYRNSVDFPDIYRQISNYIEFMKSGWYYVPPFSDIFINTKEVIETYSGLLLPVTFYVLVFISILSDLINRKFDDNSKLIVILFIYGVMSVNQLVIFPNIGRITQILPLMFVATIYLYAHSARIVLKRFWKSIYFILLGGVNAALIIFIMLSCMAKDVYANGSILIRLSNTSFINHPKMKIFATQSQATDFNNVTKAIETFTDAKEYIFTFPDNSQLFYFVTGRKSIKFSIISEYAKSDSRQLSVIKSLKDNNVRFIVSDKRDRRGYLSPILEEYIKTNYITKMDLGNYLILMAK